MRWVLIRPLNESLFYDPEIQEPLGLEYLASTLVEQGCKALLLDSALDNLDNCKLARRAASFQPDAIGFSITTDRELDSIWSIYSDCKALLAGKEVFWIAGGNYVTAEFGNAQVKLPGEFHLMRYEGETSLKTICAYWEKSSVHKIPRLISGSPAIPLDKLPFPARRYSYHLRKYGWAFNLQGSRGCCSACAYCASKGMRKEHHPSWRGRSPENIVRELTYLYEKYNARAFNFVDEDFLGPPSMALDRAARFAEGIRRNKLKITMGIQVRPNSLSEEIIDYLATAGLTYVFLGIESDDPRDFKAWRRAYCDKTWDWVSRLQEKDIEVNAGTLLFHPDCTLEGIRRFASKLRQYGLLNCRTAINRLDAMPGSSMYDEYAAAHPEHKYRGIHTLPFRNAGIEGLYQTLVDVLAPVEAPSMHALCAMPVCRTNKVYDKDEWQLPVLRQINRVCDQRVSACFFSILDMFETGTMQQTKVERMIKENICFGRSVAKNLIEHGFVRSPEALYAAINED
ncbi:MAG: radical SAM protein [Tannerellaceae bacterium]|jgi:radical SAM superfamily enzyme YgiQ (UPF0313 family)|nr:radical SAM protein [Tannerellaceae bacterium]